MFSVLKGLTQAIFVSVFTYPSNIFWIPSLSTAIMFLLSVSTLVSKRHFTASKFLVVTEMINDTYTATHFMIASVLTSICLIFLCKYIHDYYSRSHKNSDPQTKTKLKVYLGMFIFIAVLMIITNNLSVFLSIPIRRGYGDVLKHVQLISYIIFISISPIVHIIPRSIVRMKHPTKAIPGFSLISMQVLFGVISIALLLVEKFIQLNGIFNKIYSISSLLAYNINGLLYVFDAMGVLGHRFIRFFKYLPKPKQPHALRVRGKVGV